MYKMALLVKKVEGAESCMFLTEEIIAAKNLHFAPQFPKIRTFQCMILHFWMQIFSPKKNYEN